MIYQLTREEVLKVCSECEHFEPLTGCCKKDPNERKQLHLVKKCKKWDDHFGDICLFRG